MEGTDFEAVYREYYQDVFRFLDSLCRDELLAEELAQETFFRALRAYPGFRGECSVRVWLCQIAKNLYFSHCRKEKRLRPILPEAPGTGEDPAGWLAGKEREAQLRQLIDTLPEPYREVFLLRVLGELPFSELGRLFQKTEGWARVTYHRAKQRLAERMKGELP